MATKVSKHQPQAFSNRIERVAITGAGGQFGRLITEALLKTGKHAITAITRPNSPNQIPEGAQVVHVDYNAEDDTPLVEALRGQQALIITLSFLAPPNTISKLIRAAAKAGVPYVLPNWFSQDATNDALCSDVFLRDRRDAIISEIEQLGVSAYILLACGSWYEFSLGGGPDRYGFDFRKRSLTWFDGGDVRINTTTWPQSARAIANLLSLKVLPDGEGDSGPALSGFRNRTVYVSSFRVSQRDIFESVKRVTDTADADWSFGEESAVQRWEDAHSAVKQGRFEAFPKQLYSRLFFANGGGEYQSTKGLHNDVLGLPVEDLDEWTAIAIRMGETGEISEDGRFVRTV